MSLLKWLKGGVYSQVKFSEFVREHLGEWPGPIVDIDGAAEASSSSSAAASNSAAASSGSSSSAVVPTALSGSRRVDIRSDGSDKRSPETASTSSYSNIDSVDISVTSSNNRATSGSSAVRGVSTSSSDGADGSVVGIHSGYWFYTVGQRGGIKLSGGPW